MREPPKAALILLLVEISAITDARGIAAPCRVVSKVSGQREERSAP